MYHARLLLAGLGATALGIFLVVVGFSAEEPLKPIGMGLFVAALGAILLLLTGRSMALLNRKDPKHEAESDDE